MAYQLFFKRWGGARKKPNGWKLNGRTYDDLPRCRVEEGRAIS
jgi:protein gp37